MANCPKCGRSNPVGTPLCGSCGASLPQGSAPGEPASVPDQPTNEPDIEVKSLLRSGNKIAAIKAYREKTGVGLKEAKDAIDALDSQQSNVSKPSGCAGVLLLAILIGGTLATWVSWGWI